MKTALVCALALVLAPAGCKDKDSKKDKTAGVAKPTAEKPAPACPPGQVMDQGTCVQVVTPDKVAAVKKQAQQMATLSDTLAKIETVEAPLALIKLLMTTDAWKTVAKGSKDLQSAEDVVKTLQDSLKDLKKLAASATTGRQAIDALVQRLAAIQGGTATVKNLDDLRKQLTAELVAALEPLAKQAQKLAKDALDPAIKQIEKMLEWTEAVCAIVKLSGSDELKKQCKDSKTAADAVVAWIASIKKLPDTMVSDIVKELNGALDQMIDSKALGQLVK